MRCRFALGLIPVILAGCNSGSGGGDSDSVPPVIQLQGANPLAVEVGAAYVDPGASATDNVDGDLTGSIITDASAVDTSTPGDYAVSYTVRDSAGNSASVTRMIVVRDTTPPSLVLIGENPQVVLAGTTYLDLGATATDSYDGDLTDQIAADSSALDLTTSGTYSVVYSISDAAGNAAETEREIRVVVSGRWSVAANGSEVNVADHAITLADGRVLLVGNPASGSSGSFAWIYDAVADEFLPVDIDDGLELSFGASATLLLDGRVLITGGRRSRMAMLFDPVATRIRQIGSMISERSYHTATRLADGRVLIAGGRADDPAGGPFDVTLESAELFDPADESFSATGPLITGRHIHTATMLSDNTVLIVAGVKLTGQPGTGESLASAERYDPATGTFVDAGILSGGARSAHSATRLDNGNVLVLGGEDNGPFAGNTLFDSTTGSFAAAEPLLDPRGGHVAVVLSSGPGCPGPMLIAGGFVDGQQRAFDPTATAEMFDPVLQRFYSVEAMPEAAEFVGGTLLQDERVFVQTTGIQGTGKAFVFEPVGSCN